MSEEITIRWQPWTEELGLKPDCLFCNDNATSVACARVGNSSASMRSCAKVVCRREAEEACRYFFKEWKSTSLPEVTPPSIPTAWKRIGKDEDLV